MNDELHPFDAESLEPPLEAAVDTILAEPIPEDAIARIKTRARELAATPIPPYRTAGSNLRRWNARRSLIVGLTAAAVLLAVAIAGSFLLNLSGGRAFAQMIEKVKAISSVHFTTATRFGRGPEITGLIYLEGNRSRLEQFDGSLIQVADLDRKKALVLETPGKIAQVVDFDVEVARRVANPIEQLQHAKSADAEQIGEEILRGRRTQIFRLRKVDLLDIRGPGEMLVWVDVESRLPAKIVIRDPDPKTESEFRFDEFVWNEPLAARLFSLDMPEGYHTGVVMMTPHRPDSSQPDEAPPEASSVLADGILSRDRVPARIVWGPDGKTITALMQDPESVPPQDRRDNELRQWDVATGKLRWAEKVLGASWLAGTADGKTLATVIGYEMQVRDAASGKITRKWATEEHLSPLAFSPDGKMLAAGITQWGRSGGGSGKESGGVQFWNIERASLVRFLSDDKPVTFVRYSVDGKYLASSSNDGPVKLWDVATGELTRIFPGCSGADFSPDGKTIACQAAGSPSDWTVGRVDLRNVRDGSLVESFASEKAASASCLLSVAFSPGGRLLVASDWNGTVTLWNVATGERKLTIAGMSGVHAAVFAPDGATLATGSEDKILRLRKLPAELIRPVRKIER